MKIRLADVTVRDDQTDEIVQFGVNDPRTMIMAMKDGWMPSKQLMFMKKIEGWFKLCLTFFTGIVDLKRIVRMFHGVNGALARIWAEGKPMSVGKIKLIEDADAVPDGQAFVAPDIFRAIREVIKEYAHDVEKPAMIPHQIRNVMLDCKDEVRTKAFWHAVCQGILIWFAMINGAVLSLEWVAKHLDLPQLGGMFGWWKKHGGLDKEWVKAAYNRWLKNVIQQPLKKWMLGIFGVHATLSYNDALDDGRLRIVETKKWSGCAGVLIIKGAGYKVAFREMPELGPREIWVNPKNCVVRGVKEDGLWAVIGTHTRRWAEMNRVTANQICPKMNGADFDIDSANIGIAAFAGTAFRTPTSNHGGLIGIEVEWPDGHVDPASPMGYPWNGPLLVDFNKKREKLDLAIDFSKPEDDALIEFAEKLQKAWRPGSVGKANLMSQAANYLGRDPGIKQFLQEMEEVFISGQKQTDEEFILFEELTAEAWAEGTPQPVLMMNKFPKCAPVVTNCPEDTVRDWFLQKLYKLNLNFEGCTKRRVRGEPFIPFEGVQMTDLDAKFFNAFFPANIARREDMREERKLDSDFNALKYTAAFIKAWREGAIRLFGSEEELKKHVPALLALHHLKPDWKANVIDGINGPEDQAKYGRRDWKYNPDQTLLSVLAPYVD